MNELNNQSLSHLTAIFSNNTTVLIASQIAALAIQLSDGKTKNDIIPNMDLAAELIVAAKKKITREMIQS